MAEDRSKLLLLGGPHIPADVLAPILEQHFSIVSPPPGGAMEALQDPGVKAILAGASDFQPLERQLVARETTALLDAIGEGVALCDAAGAPLWTSSSFSTFEPAFRKRVFSCCAEAARDLAGWVKAKEEARPSRKYDVATDDGERFFEVVVTPVASSGASQQPDDNGEDPAGRKMLAVLWDVTAARTTQHKIDAIDRAGAELVQIEAETVRRLNAAERLAMLEEKIVRYAGELLHFDHFVIRLLDRESGRLDVVMSRGLPEEALKHEFYVNDVGSGITGYVAATKRSYICYDTSKDKRYVQGMHRAASSLTIPLLLRDMVIGVLNVESNQVGAFSEDDKQFSEIFARYIAMALHTLDILVVERYTTNETISGAMRGEVAEPLEDLAVEAEWLKTQEAFLQDPERARHVERILKDVESIRRRVRAVASGPRSLLGAERALREGDVDPRFAGKRVLVADDEPTIRETIATVLRQRGAQVVSCPDGASAVGELEKSIACRQTPMEGVFDGYELVISDIKMPDRNGYEVFSAARKLNTDIPVILMTGFGYDPHHSVVRASQEGLQCVLFKPFQVDRLLEEVRKALEKASRPPG
ncbi:MAG: response regulator [Planctomycetota bacterium]|nr:response regulator [Planctomycetota bacterium]